MNINTLLGIVIQLLIIAGVFWLIWWLVGYANPPEPFNKIIRVIVAVVAVLFLINLLLGLGGTPLVRWR